jgi:hypothetical protein
LHQPQRVRRGDADLTARLESPVRFPQHGQAIAIGQMFEYLLGEDV